MLKSMLSPFADRSYALLRIVSGLMFAFHGMQKVFDVFGDRMNLGTQAGIGGVIELVAGLAIAAGLFTRWAAFLASGTMAVAYFQFHMKMDKVEGLMPPTNGGELAVLYCWLFLLIACRGAVAWGVDSRKEQPASAS